MQGDTPSGVPSGAAAKGGSLVVALCGRQGMSESG